MVNKFLKLSFFTNLRKWPTFVSVTGAGVSSPLQHVENVIMMVNNAGDVFKLCTDVPTLGNNCHISKIKSYIDTVLCKLVLREHIPGNHLYSS